MNKVCVLNLPAVSGTSPARPVAPRAGQVRAQCHTSEQDDQTHHAPRRPSQPSSPSRSPAAAWAGGSARWCQHESQAGCAGEGEAQEPAGLLALRCDGIGPRVISVQGTRSRGARRHLLVEEPRQPGHRCIQEN